jgi:hypothetical protein
VCVISLLQFLKEALYLWNVHHIPLEQVLLIGAASHIRRSLYFKMKESISSLKGPHGRIAGHDPGDASRPLWF